jgi:uncharacterized membrane protein
LSDLVVLAFDSPAGANAAATRLEDLQKRQLITLADAAIVVRDSSGKPRVKQMHNLVGAGALGGAFWGMLIGLLFLAPWLGLAVGAVTGALAGRFTDVGIDDNFIKEVADAVKPGNSAIFLLIADVTPDKVVDDLKTLPGISVLRTNLTPEQENKLRGAFAAEEVEG